MKLSIFTFFSMLILAAAASAQIQNLPRRIQTTGEAVLTAQPDRVQIDIGVVTRAASSQAAVTENAAKVQQTLANLRSVAGPGADIRTISYDLSPNYNYPKDGGEPTITGYTATNIVRVTVDDLALTGRIIDEATRGGANRVQGLQFSLKNDEEIQNRALKEAAQQARTKAEALAAALGLRITGVLSVEESSSRPVPIRTVSYARAEQAVTPIEPGTIEIRANVNLTVEIAK
jgi:uncharacterized protein YggE